MKKHYTLILIIASISFSGLYIYNRYNQKTVSAFSNDIEKIDTTSYENLYPKENLIILNISGEINAPDYYFVEKETTLNDIINISGGITENADISNLDLNNKFLENANIVIPTVLKTSNSNENIDNKININTASKNDLKTLPSIGDILAERIIQYRETISIFYNIQDIQKVDGIGEKVYQKIKALITVD